MYMLRDLRVESARSAVLTKSGLQRAFGLPHIIGVTRVAADMINRTNHLFLVQWVLRANQYLPESVRGFEISRYTIPTKHSSQLF